MKRILFVCTGNICRSPTAEGVFHKLMLKQPLDEAIDIDSAATHSYHVGEHPDPRACDTARSRGYDIDRLVVRQITGRDFDRYDLILAMDHSHMHTLHRLADRSQHPKIKLFMSFTDRPDREVPDPYYGSQKDFELMLDMIEEGAAGLHRHFQGE